MSEIAHFINGQIVSSNSTRLQDVFNPATGNADKAVILATENDVDDESSHSDSRVTQMILLLCYSCMPYAAMLCNSHRDVPPPALRPRRPLALPLQPPHTRLHSMISRSRTHRVHTVSTELF